MTESLKKKIGIGLLLALLLVLIAACGKEKKEGSSDGIYYMNSEETAIQKEPYKIKEKDPKEAATAMLKKLSKPPEDVEMKPVIAKRVKVLEVKIEDGTAIVDFGGGYYEMSPVREILCRAAVVQSLVQIKGIDAVVFEVEGNPLMDEAGREIGKMRAEDFIKNTGSALHTYEKTDLILYFGSGDGTVLAEEELDEVRYNTNLPVEKLVVERLLKGPDSKQLLPVLDSEIRLLGISVKEGICYINFDDQFLIQESELDPALQIEAIVRSVMKNKKEIRAVQILINGKDDQNYKGISLKQPFDFTSDGQKGENQ